MLQTPESLKEDKDVNTVIKQIVNIWGEIKKKQSSLSDYETNVYIEIDVLLVIGIVYFSP